MIHQVTGTTRPLMSSRSATTLSAKQTREINGSDTVKMTVTSAIPQTYYIGDWIEVFGRIYKLNRLPKVKKDGEYSYTYELDFEGVQYDLLRVMYNVNIDTTNNTIQDVTGDSLTGDLRRFLDVMVANANRVFPGVWSVGQCPDDTKGDYTKTFGESDNCLAVLQSLCTDFEVEFDISTSDGTHFAINIGKVGQTLPQTFKYGRGGGLYEMTRDNVSSANVITRLYAFGATENITSKYRGTRLLLPGKMKADSYLENAEAKALYGVCEATKNFDVKPTHTGTVTGVVAGDVLSFVDSAFPFDINEKEDDGTTTKYLISGVPAKIHFNSGNLAGFEFEIKSYDNETKTFTLIKQTDERGNSFPSDTSVAFQVAVGNTYKIIDIAYPDSITEAAEQKLLEEATTYLSQNCQPKVSYTVGVSKLWLKRHASDAGITNYFVPGDYLHIVDEGIGVDKSIRIQAVERDIVNPYEYTLTISDTVTTQLISRVISDSITLGKVIELNDLKNPARARANWLSSREVLGMVFDVEGDYYTDKIKPQSIDTMMLSVGAKSMQFGLVGVTIAANVGGNANVLNISAGQLVHYAIADEPRTWYMGALNVTTLNPTKAYYIYASVERNGTQGVWIVTQQQYKYDVDGDRWTFLVGVLNSVDVPTNTRTIYTTYGFTTINGRFVRTGRIESADGETYFDLDLGEIGGRITFTKSDGTTGDVSDLENNVSDIQNYLDNTLPGLLDGIQSQLDGQIEQFFGDYDPLPQVRPITGRNQNEPFTTWCNEVIAGGYTAEVAESVYGQHTGDLFYNTDNGKVYRFVYKETDADGTVAEPSECWVWMQLSDEELSQALAMAQDALDTAKTKRRIFVSTPYPPYEVGDLWVQGSSGDIMVCTTERLTGSYVASDWVKSSKYTDDSALNTFIAGAYADAMTDIQDQVDGKIETWFQASDPASDWITSAIRKLHVGDMWYDTANKYLYRYVESKRILTSPSTGIETILYSYSWKRIQDQDALDAYAAASEAQDTADGKRTVFVAQPTASDAYDVGDLWVNCTYNNGGVVYNNDLLRCVTAKAAGVAFSITHWALATRYDNTKTTIDGGVVTSGTIRLAGDDSTIKSGITGNGTADTSIRIWAGATEQNRAIAPFRVNQRGEAWMTNAHVTGEVNATSGVFNNVLVKGSYRNPFTLVTTTMPTTYNDNITMLSTSENATTEFKLPWDVSQVGRRITVANFYWNGQTSAGTTIINAPSGKYFYVDGLKRTQLRINRQVVELLGYGTSSVFYGWIVMTNVDANTKYVYGSPLRIVATGLVIGDNPTGTATISAVTQDGSSMTVTRQSEGLYRVNMPSSWMADASSYLVFLQGASTQGKQRYACLRNKQQSYFDVGVSDDNTENDGSFEFIICNMAQFNNWG